jgi:hypothetical protein
VRRTRHQRRGDAGRVGGLSRPLALGVTAAVSWAALGASAAAGVETAGSVLSAARAAVAAEAGVQVEFVDRSSSPSKTETIVADVGRTSGQETITVGAARLAVRVTPAQGYVSGNPSGLITLFGLTAAQASTAGRRWVSYRAGTSQYADLKADVTMASITGLFPKAKGTTLSSEVTAGATVYVLAWTIAATSSTPKVSNRLTVSVAASLPLEATSSESDGTEATTTLSDWGAPIPVSAPPAASSIVSSRVTG